MVIAGGLLVVGLLSASALPQDTVLPPIAATVFWLALVALVVVPVVWLLRRQKDNLEANRTTSSVIWQPSAEREGDASMAPVAPGAGWATPIFVNGYWYSEGERGRCRVLGPAGWSQPHRPKRPFTSFERKLCGAIIGLVVAYVAFGVIPAVATVGPCAFVPCDRFPADTAGVTVNASGALALVVPNCVGEVRAIEIKTYPRDGDGVTVWSVERAVPGQLPEEIEIGTPPTGFHESHPMAGALPTNEDLLIRVSTTTRRFASAVDASHLAHGAVSGSAGSKASVALDEFRKDACEEAAYEEPEAPGIVVVGGIACFLVPILSVWLVVLHAIKRRKPLSIPVSGEHG